MYNLNFRKSQVTAKLTTVSFLWYDNSYKTASGQGEIPYRR